MGILENPYFYQPSVFLTQNLKKFKSIISEEINSTSAGRTLDICCGTGNFADLAKGEYLGFDLNEKYIDYAKNRFRRDKSKKFLVSSIDDFDFKPKYFDTVLLISALHHFSDKSLSDLLEKAAKAAKGKIIITDPAIEARNPISRLLFLLDRGRFIRPLEKQLELISKSLNIVKHFAFYAGLAHIRMIVCSPKNL